MQSWDMAFKDKATSDYVVGQVWGAQGADRFLLDQRRARMDMPATQEAVRALSAFSFGRLGLHRLEAACLPENEPSRRLLLRASFELEGRASAYLKINGDWRDHLLFGMVAGVVARGRSLLRAVHVVHRRLSGVRTRPPLYL